MSEYIIKIPNECFSVCDGVIHTRYYQDERHDPMPLQEIVRCRDCKDVHHRPNWQPDKRFKPQDLWLCEAEWCMGFEGDHPRVEPDGFCWRGERRES